MLRGLEIHDLLIIERLELAFQPGLNALTGETGAGKSILLDALGFVLGWRGRAELVRAGAAQGEVTAVFEIALDHPAQEILAEAGLPGGAELLLRRVNTREGRKTAWVNDRRVSGEVLRRLSETLVELHGQHDDRGLLNPRGHRAILDAYGGLSGQVQATRAAWAAVTQAEKDLTAAETALEKARADEDFLRHAADEIAALAPDAGEDEKLDACRRLMQAAERIREDITRAHSALGPDGAEGAMTDAMRWLDGVADKAEGRLDAPLSALGRALNDLGEAQQGVEHCLDDLAADPGELEQVEERLFALRALARKHQVAPDALADLGARFAGELAAMARGADDISALKAALASARETYGKAAARLSKSRHGAATGLDAAVTAELVPLKMDRAVFATTLSEAPDGPDGRDVVEFTIATNPGAPPGPLGKIASGGELSRFMLALKVCLREASTGVTMIFDEIDRGVGGATASAVGGRLAQLARGGQVLVVTHAPQVAAAADHHWRVEKHIHDGATASNVVPLDNAARVDEIARMLSGAEITDEARSAARALLKSG